MKLFAKTILPAPVFCQASRIYHTGLAVAHLWRHAIRRGYPREILHFGIAPGDDLLCTTVARELAKRQREPVWMLSNYPELFLGNNDVADTFAFRSGYQYFSEFRHLKYAHYIREEDRSEPPKQHILAELCSRVGISGEIALRPYLALKESERRGAAWAANKIAIQSCGLASRVPMRNKQWFPERFQEVVASLRKDIEFIQVGSSSDPALEHAHDFRGKAGIRETAAILSEARLFIGNVGFLMHLARAVDCPSVVVFGGREAPWQSGYTCNINLYSPEPCAPCWLLNRCDYGRICMERISADDVIRAVEQQLERSREQLAVDIAKISCQT